MTLRILVEPSDYILRNAGDTAMLRVAVTRLGTLWPDAIISVFTEAADRFPPWVPNAVPVCAAGRYAWFRTPFLTGRLPAAVGAAVHRAADRIQHHVRRERPQLARRLLKTSLRRQGEDADSIDTFLDAVREADLVVANGMGGITDVFPEYAFELLEVMRLAQRRGAVTALLGQGLGPLDDPDLRERAGEVLRRADLIALRERRAGLPLLRELGISEERVVTTGDDAVEIAYSARPSRLGDALGINMRLASYSDVDRQTIDRVRPAIARLERELNAPLVPIAISSVAGEEDAVTARRLMARDDDASVEVSVQSSGDLAHLLDDVGRCRVVIAGSYHAAVFALSMGIPAIGLFGSPYYRDKFLGLADMFGDGCWALSLRTPDLEGAIVETTRAAWQRADELRPDLLAAAAEQVQAGHAAYERLRTIVSARLAHPSAGSTARVTA